jgi:hypothetical protein
VGETKSGDWQVHQAMQIFNEIGPVFSANQQSQRADVYTDDALRPASNNLLNGLKDTIE